MDKIKDTGEEEDSLISRLLSKLDQKWANYSTGTILPDHLSVVQEGYYTGASDMLELMLEEQEEYNKNH